MRAGRWLRITLVDRVLLSVALVFAACSRSALELPVVDPPAREPATEGPALPTFKADPSQARADRIDLLFVIDDSGSMEDKQALLIEAIPDMVARLVRPRCVDELGVAVADQPQRTEAPCPAGSAREFNGVQDMHVGVVTTGVASMGTCMRDFGTPTRGHLQLPRSDFAYNGQQFVAWDPGGVKDPPGLRDPDQLNAALSDLVARGGGGCPDEASLEAFYRFLIEPAPSAEVVPCFDGDGRPCLATRGIDEALLRERAAFLRPDSLLAVIVLSDENDCSMAPFGDGRQFVVDSAPRARPTSVCERAPEDPCCQPCDAPAAPGCPAPAGDDNCRRGPYTEAEDPPLLRCWDQKRRFGLERRFPVARYVRGLTEPTVPVGLEGEAPNPIFAATRPDGTPVRDPSLVYFAAIVGVPWQDLAEDPFDHRDLRYLSGPELAEAGAWERVIGSVRTNHVPTDPLMIESLAERSGVQPVWEAPLQPSTADQPWANPINGHETDLLTLTDLPFRSDLQYACIFALEHARECSDGEVDCDCGQSPEVLRKPICQDEGGRYSHRQWGGKAFPGVRQLRLSAALPRNGLAASICARNVRDRARQDYGYRPALEALVDRLRLGLN